MNISLAGWIRAVKDDIKRVIDTIHDIRYDYKGEIFDDLLDSAEEAKRKSFGFMEDMNNIFSDLKELKTDEQKIKWVNHIKEFLSVNELVFENTGRTLIKKTEEDDDKKVEAVQEGDTWQKRFVREYKELKEKSIKLRDMLAEYKSGTLDFKPNCSFELLKEQYEIMDKYLFILEQRSKIEKVFLSEGR